MSDDHPMLGWLVALALLGLAIIVGGAVAAVFIGQRVQ